MIIQLPRYLTKTWQMHLVLWVLSLYIMANYFAISNEVDTIDYLYSILFHGCLVSIVYLNLSILIPYLLQKERYLLYLIGGALTIALGLVIHSLLFDVLGPWLIDDYFFVSFTERSVLIRIFGIYLILSSLLRLSSSWFVVQQLAQEKTALELAALKSQLNPHFLFNGLNGIYALALSQNEKAPAAILKLSELLRYVLYEINQDVVELSKEIQILDHYLELQKLRLKNPEIISFSVKGETETVQIPPMLFLPIIENAFKHGDLTNGIIKIDVSTTGKAIKFTCQNQISKASVDGSKGIGLENIGRRLELILAGKYQFEIREENGFFLVSLNLQLT